MIGFKYTYLGTEEIFEKINYISENLFPGLFFVSLSILIIFLLNNYIFPIILFSVENYKKELKKQERRILLRKILLQKEVEDEIEKDLK
ncbi:MAG: hypothetical protein Q9M94_05420 [Candidatus Gracilibacteria bacterium]|nr:hypothetical protein [Candidatus Gracilibacteria bacterium]